MKPGFIRLTSSDLERRPVTIPTENIAFFAGTGKGQNGNTAIQLKAPPIAMSVHDKPEDVEALYLAAMTEGGIHGTKDRTNTFGISSIVGS